MLCVSCGPEEPTEELGIFEAHRISGQIETAEKLKVYMDNKEYDKAIELFSNRQQPAIAKIRENDEYFRIWCLAWTLDDGKLERYTTLIRKDKAPFVFEDNEFKIDEK